MSRIFRKRTNSKADATERPTTNVLRKSPSSSGLRDPSTNLNKARQATRDVFEGRGIDGKEKKMVIPDKPPSLDVDIRNSLILPGLSQRFSVLLPSLSNAPERSIRDLLATQRARPDGPSLTVEEEELLFAEMRQNTSSHREDRSRPMHLERDLSSRSLASAGSGRSQGSGDLSTSISSPSLSPSDRDQPPSSAPVNTSPSWPVSPPPTSTSFSSFKTFGVDDSGLKTKSYGFSGNAGFRDAEYIRKAKKNGPARVAVNEEADDHWTDSYADYYSAPSPKMDQEPHSPAESERTATPTSSAVLTFPSSSSSAPSSATFHPPPQSPPPSGPLPSLPETSSPTSANARTGKKRQSLLQGLTPAQVKRISMALGEIEGKLSRTPLADPERVIEEDEEELLRPASSIVDQTKEEQAVEIIGKTPPRRGSDAQRTEPPSPSRLPPSPRSLNLHAHIARPDSQGPIAQPAFQHPNDDYRPSIPRPIMTPSRTQPIRHKPSPSLSSDRGQTPPNPVYVPGQPRPVGSYHRSEGSTSSRSGTPTQVNMLSASTSSQHTSDQSPTPLHTDQYARNALLNRSQSVTQAEGRSRSPNVDVTKHLRAQSLDAIDSPHRGSSSLGMHPTSETIEEEDGEAGSPYDSAFPEIKPVPGRHTVFDNQQGHFQESEDLLQPESSRVKSRVVSQQATIADSSEASDLSSMLQSPTRTLRRLASTDTIGSDYNEDPSDNWERILGANPDDTTQSTWPDNINTAGDMLRKLSGIGLDDLSTLQDRLVEKAKVEREILRGGVSDSPEPSLSSAFEPIRHAHPSMSHDTHSPSKESDQVVASPTRPTDTSTSSPEPVSRKPSSGNRSAASTLTRRPAPPPPAESASSVPLETPVDEVVKTPSTSALSRKGSRKVAPEDDPDVRRDFEARIAAATAALNRTPSTTASLGRKNTKRGGAFKISSPTLVSSSAKIAGATPVTPSESPIDPTVAKALEKASGSGSKMGMRWRKLGFKRGPSISNTSELYSPPPSAMSASQAARLQDPISLPGQKSPPEPPKSAPNVMPSTSGSNPTDSKSPDLNAFRFPRQEQSSASIAQSQSAKARPAAVETARNETLGNLETVAMNPLTAAFTAQTKQTHSSTSSNDSAIAKFIEAGRAVGLNDEQLQDMLVTKGMIKQPDSTPTVPVNSQALTATFPNIAPQSETGPMPTVTRSSSQTKKATSGKGLFRSLSRSKKARPSITEPTEDAGKISAPVEPVPRNVIVRRTLVLPTDLPQASFLNPLDSPASSSHSRPSPNQRKLSIKRKPVNLTREDHALVSGSPPPQQRKFSTTTASSATSDHAGNPGLGFLHPGTNLGRSTSSVAPSEGDSAMTRSSTGGSLYDLYGDDANQETLISPTPTGAQPSTPAKRLTQAIEIKEYADGKMVWSVVDALRDDEEEEIEFGTPGNLSYHQPNSRSQSSDSGRPESGGDIFHPGSTTGLVTNTAGLKLRHRDRGQTAPRPPTNVFYTSANDVADLIDSLSADPNASGRGRIDIFPSSGNHTSSSSPFPYSATTPSPKSDSPNPAITGQFEDAPSPQRRVPAPITLPRPYAEGHPIPHRQLFPSQPQRQRGLGSIGSLGHSDASPSAASFASSTSGIPGRTVEDRLQALIDRLKESGVKAS